MIEILKNLTILIANKLKFLYQRSGHLILIRSSNPRTLEMGFNSFKDFPFTNTDIKEQSLYYDYLGNGSIRIKRDGFYQLSAALSVRDLPGNERKYILAAYKGSVRLVSLTRGSVNLPSQDYWGVSGSSIFDLKENDEITFKYLINGSGTVTSNIMNISILKVC